MSTLVHVDAENFTEVVLKSSTPVIVDFWAEWCGPCRALAPVLEELSRDLGDRALIVKLNVDVSRDLAAQYGIRGIPTLLFFKDGQVVSTLVGTQSREAILKSIDQL